jgi:hypothetical protein
MTAIPTRKDMPGPPNLPDMPCWAQDLGLSLGSIQEQLSHIRVVWRSNALFWKAVSFPALHEDRT